MTARTLTRAGFIAAATSALSLAMAPLAEARRDPQAEAYVQTNASTALATISDARLSADERKRQFAVLMDRFSNVSEIAGRVLGPYGRTVFADPQLRADWVAAFREYAFATYETRLARYRGNAVRVVDSNELVAGRRVEVLTHIVPRGETRPLPVRWRLNRSGESWKVVDVSLVLDGGEIWLAEQQRQEFLAYLDRNNRDVRALIGAVREMTSSMREQAMARN